MSIIPKRGRKIHLNLHSPRGEPEKDIAMRLPRKYQIHASWIPAFAGMGRLYFHTSWCRWQATWTITSEGMKITRLGKGPGAGSRKDSCLISFGRSINVFPKYY
jgi:hypothetical protein